MKQTTRKPVTAAARLNEGLNAARKQLTQVEKEIVTEARKQRRSLEKVLARVRSGADLKRLETRITSTATELQSRVLAMPREVLGALGVATSDDVAKLAKTMTKLSKRVDELSKARTGLS